MTFTNVGLLPIVPLETNDSDLHCFFVDFSCFLHMAALHQSKLLAFGTPFLRWDVF